MAEERSVHGYRVMFEKEAEEGVHYLDQRLEADYARVFFAYAQQHRTAPFMNMDGHRFLLSYDNGVYVVTRK